MKKNVASQVVSAVVVSATDGSAITASVAVTVTGDAGTQGAGGGTLVHEGGGEWSYVPTQAETNFDHIMFKFSATGAVPVGIQVYTTFPQTGDSFARIGATGSGLTSLATQASVDTIDTNVDAILVDTGTTLDGKLDTIDTNVDSILVDTGTTLDGKLDTIDTNVDSILADTGTDGVVLGAGAISTTTFGAGAIDAAALSTDAGQELADRFLTRRISGGADTGRTVAQALAPLRNKWEIVAGVLTVYDIDDTTPLFTTAIATAASDPVSGSDPD